MSGLYGFVNLQLLPRHSTPLASECGEMPHLPYASSLNYNTLYILRDPNRILSNAFRALQKLSIPSHFVVHSWVLIMAFLNTESKEARWESSDEWPVEGLRPRRSIRFATAGRYQERRRWRN